MLISIDNYYDVNFYNQCLTALKNNGIKYKEYLSTTGSFNWYIDIPQKPIMVNYDVCPKSEERYLVSKVNSLIDFTRYKYYRRLDSQGVFAEKYIINDYFEDIKDKEAWVFKVNSKNDLERLSSLDENARIWYLGKYLGNRVRFAITTSELIRVFIKREDIFYSKKDNEKLDRFETEFNYRVLMGKDKLAKFDFTPYFENGKLKLPLYYNEIEKMRYLVL